MALVLLQDLLARMGVHIILGSWVASDLSQDRPCFFDIHSMNFETFNIVS
jgi:hypothetical protein